MAVANQVWMLENAVYSVLSQKGLRLSCGKMENGCRKLPV